jgi:crotonobetainyl-CoA:carnitine CoA-transferase CaiB-like acyl-CoA transferase
VPCGPVYTMDEVFADPQVRHLAMTEPVEHPALGRPLRGRDRSVTRWDA